MPALVVVAAQDVRTTIGLCLKAVAAQLGPGDAMLVVDASRDGTAAAVRRDFPVIRLISGAPGALIPQLWRDGLAATTDGPWELVVLTTAHCVPDDGWLVGLRTAVSMPGTAAAGGPIEPGPEMGVCDWAVYLQRYSGMMRPLPRGPVADLAGDNAVYRRSALADIDAATADLIATGFWEPFVHAALQRQGWRLTTAPDAVVRYHRSYGVRAFCVQRFRHGRSYGAWRTVMQPGRLRAVRAGTAPFVPILLLGRIALRVRRKGRFGREFLRAAPLLALFLVAWAAGELVGVVAGSPDVPSGVAQRAIGMTARSGRR